MFVTGEPRSGTTLMHALMSVDPDARALRFWEVMYPSPPPGIVGAGRSAHARAPTTTGARSTPSCRSGCTRHPYNDMLGDGLPEDERTWAFDFRVMTPTAWWRVPMQTVVQGLPTDAAAQYRIHKAMLQQFQYGRPQKYWVLKGFHGFRLKEFFDAYPDATLVWLHRDPVQVAASRTMMMADIMEGIVGPIDLKAEAKKHLELTRASIANTMTNPMVDDPRIHHVRYRDFVSDQIGTIRGYYEFAGRRADAAGRGGDARLPRQQQGRPLRQVPVLDHAADRHRRGPRRPARGVPAVPRALRRRDRDERLSRAPARRVCTRSRSSTRAPRRSSNTAAAIGVQHTTLVTPVLMRPGGVDEAQRALARRRRSGRRR